MATKIVIMCRFGWNYLCGAKFMLLLLNLEVINIMIKVRSSTRLSSPRLPLCWWLHRKGYSRYNQSVMSFTFATNAVRFTRDTALTLVDVNNVVTRSRYCLPLNTSLCWVCRQKTWKQKEKVENINAIRSHWCEQRCWRLSTCALPW